MVSHNMLVVEDLEVASGIKIIHVPIGGPKIEAIHKGQQQRLRHSSNGVQCQRNASMGAHRAMEDMQSQQS